MTRENAIANQLWLEINDPSSQIHKANLDGLKEVAGRILTALQAARGEGEKRYSYYEYLVEFTPLARNAKKLVEDIDAGFYRFDPDEVREIASALLSIIDPPRVTLYHISY